jgi:hypothetical protein
MSDTNTEDSEKDAPRCIQLGDETLIPDPDYCATKLGGATQRTAQKYDKLGQPYVMIRGEKWRPLNVCAAFWAGRIIRKEPQRPKRRYSARTATASP